MRLLGRLVALLVLALVTACATPQPTGPSAEERAAYGDVAVVLVDEPWERHVAVPARGPLRGMALGTVRGVGGAAAVVVYFTLSGAPGGPFVMIVTGAMGVVVGAVYIPVSVVGGTATAIPTDEVDAALPAFVDAIHDPELQQVLRDELTSHAEARLDRPLVDRDAAKTIVEVRLLSVRTGTPTAAVTMDAPFPLHVEAHVRVLQPAEQELVWVETLRHWDEKHRYLAWAKDDAALARTALRRTIGHLAEELAIVVFEGRRPQLHPKKERFDLW